MFMPRGKMTWQWSFGVAKHDASKYILEYESSPIPQNVFNKIYALFVKRLINKPMGDLKVGEVITIPLEMVNKNSTALLFGLPKVQPKDEKLITKNIEAMYLERHKDGWVIRADVVGIRRVR